MSHTRTFGRKIFLIAFMDARGIFCLLLITSNDFHPERDNYVEIFAYNINISLKCS